MQAKDKQVDKKDSASNVRQLPGSGSNKQRMLKQRKQNNQEKPIIIDDLADLKHRKSEEFEMQQIDRMKAPASEALTNTSIGQSPMIDRLISKRESFAESIEHMDQPKRQMSNQELELHKIDKVSSDMEEKKTQGYKSNGSNQGTKKGSKNRIKEGSNEGDRNTVDPHHAYQGDGEQAAQSNRTSSSSSCKSFESQVSMRSLNARGPTIPEPLPLWDGDGQEEPAKHTGFRRATKIFKSGFNNEDSFKLCSHSEVNDWKCASCNKRVSQFDIIFDDFQGRCTKYLKVCYENQFLQDFLTEQVSELEQLAVQERQGLFGKKKEVNDSDSNDCDDGADIAGRSPIKSEKRNPDIIYQCYQPLNVTELREYMLFCMSRDIQSANIMRDEAEKISEKDNEKNSNDQETQSNMLNKDLETANRLDDIPEEELPKSIDERIQSIRSTYYVPYDLDEKLGSGRVRNLSARLTKYMLEFDETQERLMRKYNGDVLLFDTIFESGNLLRADRITRSEYRLYMQVDTNTKGHQQWFYFRVKNTQKKRKYFFKIMNFTKPGVTGGSGYRKNELFQRVMYKSRKSGNMEWSSIGPDKLEFVKTKVQRKKKDALAAGADSDQDDWVEEAYGNDPNLLNLHQQPTGLASQGMDDEAASPTKTGIGSENFTGGIRGINKEQVSSLKKKRKFYYYSLVFEVNFEHDEDVVFFAFSQPYTYNQVFTDILHKEDQIKPNQSSQIQMITSKVFTKNYQQPEGTRHAIERQQTMPMQTSDKLALARATTQVKPELKEKDKDGPSANQNANNGEPQNGPPPQPGIQFENKNMLIYYKRQELCRTICGLPIWQITISREAKNIKKKPTIIISSRVHSGETPASIVFNGILDFLCSDKKEAKFLRKFYTFVLIPILNPDGVVCGNYRNSVAGVDLNRQWINPDVEFHPEVFHIKQLFKNFTEIEKRQIWIYCDIHGHSKKKNSFFYGCNTAANGGFLSWTIVRILPRIFAQKTHLFHYKDCRFKVEPYKIGTGRVVAWKQFQITHSFTLENSFYGFDFGEEESKEFSEDDYLNVGAKLVESVYELHFVWKQIKRELQITNGWLKPKVLFEKTGVPAAQLLQEELAKKKREEMKMLAIQQYQVFLKKYYAGRGAVINPLPKQNAKEQDQLLMPNQSQGQNQLSVQNFPFQKGSQSGKGSLQGSNQKPSKLGINQPSPAQSKLKGEETDNSSIDLYGKSRNPNGRGTQENHPNSKTGKNSLNNQDLVGLRPNSSHNQLQQQARLMQKNSQNSMNTEDNEDSSAQALYKSLQGLVKLQALVRGIRARKRVAKLLRAQRKKNGLDDKDLKTGKRLFRGVSSSIQKHTTSNSVLQSISQRSNEEPRLASYREKRKNQTDSESVLDGELLEGVKLQNQNMEFQSNQGKQNPLQDSKDTLSGSNFERMSSRRLELLQRDWRHYFQETELDNAFQRVEIEQREISEEGSSAGSTSNPSDDNLDEEELADKVYNITSKQQKTKLIKEKKEQEKKFMKQVQDQLKITGQQMYAKISGKPNTEASASKDQNAGRSIQSSVPSRRGTLKFYRGFNQKANSNILNNIGTLNGNGIQSQSKQSPDKLAGNGDLNSSQMNGMSATNAYYASGNSLNGNGLQGNHQMSGHGGIMSQQSLGQRMSIAQSPLNAPEQYQSYDYNLSTTNIAFQQIHGRGILLSRDQIKQGKQQRANSSHPNGINPSMLNHQYMMHQGYQHGHPQSVHQPNISQHMRNLNFKGNYGKKENINQVIKDCFITKKCGVRKPQSQSQSHTNAQTKGKLIDRQSVKGHVMNDQGHQHNYRSHTNSNNQTSNKKQKRIKRTKSPVNSFENHNQFYRSSQSTINNQYTNPNYGTQLVGGQFNNMGQFAVNATVNQKLAQQFMMKQQQIMQMQRRLEGDNINYDLQMVNQGAMMDMSSQGHLVQNSNFGSLDERQMRHIQEEDTRLSLQQQASNQGRQNNVSLKPVRVNMTNQPQQYSLDHGQGMSGRKPVQQSPFNSFTQSANPQFSRTQYQNGQQVNRPSNMINPNSIQFEGVTKSSDSQPSIIKVQQQAWAQNGMTPYGSEMRVLPKNHGGNLIKRKVQKINTQSLNSSNPIQVNAFQPLVQNMMQVGTKNFDEGKNSLNPSQFRPMNITYTQSFKDSSFENQNGSFVIQDEHANFNQSAKEPARKVKLPDIQNLSFSQELAESFQNNLHNLQLDPYALKGKPQNQSNSKQVSLINTSDLVTGASGNMGTNSTMQNHGSSLPYGGSNSALHDNLDSSMCNTGSAYRIQTADNMRLLNKSQTSPKMKQNEGSNQSASLITNYGAQNKILQEYNSVGLTQPHQSFTPEQNRTAPGISNQTTPNQITQSQGMQGHVMQNHGIIMNAQGRLHPQQNQRQPTAVHNQLQPQNVAKNVNMQQQIYNVQGPMDEQSLMVSNIKNIYKDIKRERSNAAQAHQAVRTSSAQSRTYASNSSAQKARNRTNITQGSNRKQNNASGRNSQGNSEQQQFVQDVQTNNQQLQIGNGLGVVKVNGQMKQAISLSNASDMSMRSKRATKESPSISKSGQKHMDRIKSQRMSGANMNQQTNAQSSLHSNNRSQPVAQVQTLNLKSTDLVCQ